MLFTLVLFLSCERDISGINKNNGTSSEPDTTSHNFVWTIDTIGTFGSRLFDVFAIAEEEVWAVGEIHTAETDTFDSLGNWVQPYNAIHWDGNSWNTSRITVRLDYGDGNVIYTDSDIIKTVFGLNKSDFWFVSGAGGVTRFNDNQWTYLEIPYGSGPGGANEIWGNVSNNLYFVSSNGLITYYNGLIWQKMESGTDLRLTDIWGLSENDIYAVGADMSSLDNVVLHYDGTSWKKLPTDQNRKVSVWGTAPDNLYFVGDGVYHYDGKNYQLIDWPTGYPPIFSRAVRGTESNNIFVAGDFGMVLHYNGESWQPYWELLNMSGTVLKAISVVGKSVFIVGSADYRGIIFHGRRID